MEARDVLLGLLLMAWEFVGAHFWTLVAVVFGLWFFGIVAALGGTIGKTSVQVEELKDKLEDLEMKLDDMNLKLDDISRGSDPDD